MEQLDDVVGPLARGDLAASSDADPAVSPRRGWSGGQQQRCGEGADSRREHRGDPALPHEQGDSCGREGSGCEQPTDCPPAAGRGEERDQAEASGQRSGDGSDSIRRVGDADVSAEARVALAEQRDDQRELVTRDDRSRQDHERRHDGPDSDVADEAEGPEAAEDDGRHGDAVAHSEGNHQAQRFEGAGPGEAGEGGGPVLPEARVDPATDTDAEERDAQDQPEGVGRATKDRAEHPVPDQLHEQEREARDRCSSRREPPKVRGQHGARAGLLRSGSVVLRGRRSARDGPSGHADEGIDEARDPQGHSCAEHFQQDEVGGERTGHGSDGVDGIERSDVAAPGIAGAGHRLGRGGERASHQERRHAEHDDREQQPYEGRAGQSEDRGAADREVELSSPEHEQRCERGAQRDPELEVRVQRQGAGELVGALAQQQATDAEPSHEDGEDRGVSGSGRTEDELELPKPGDLIDQRAQSREEEQRSDRGHGGAGGALRGLESRRRVVRGCSGARFRHRIPGLGRRERLVHRGRGVVVGHRRRRYFAHSRVSIPLISRSAP